MANTTLYYNAKIYTLDKEGEFYEAMLIKNGLVAKLYKNKPILDNKTNEIDCGGKTILPSFSDAHMHFVFSAFVMGMGLCISEITPDGIVPNNFSDLRTKIGEYIKSSKSNIVLCYNYMVAGFQEQRLPTRFELEEWFPDATISIVSMDGHSSVHTQTVLEYAGIYKNGHNGVLSGEEHEFNTGKLFGYYQKKKLNLFSMIKSLKKVTNLILSYGVTDITCLEGSDDQSSNLPFYLTKAARLISKLTIRLSPQLTDTIRVKKLVGKEKMPKVGGCSTWEMDGAIGSKTAAFDIPYLDDENNKGKAYYNQEQAYDMLNNFHIEGYQTLIHAIGTKAIDTTIKAYQKVLGTKSDNENRCRIEHFEFPTHEHIKSAADMNLCISVQPGYSWMDYRYQHSYEKWIDKKLFDRQIPLKAMYEKGIMLLGSSDSPVQLPNPFLQIQGMINYPITEQRLSVYQALRTYTYNNAYANFCEDKKGTLIEGKTADFVVVDQNPFEIDNENLVSIKVINTYINGNRVY